MWGLEWKFLKIFPLTLALQALVMQEVRPTDESRSWGDLAQGLNKLECGEVKGIT